jgi:hypothetical protein
MLVKEDYVSQKQALALKELGFNVECEYGYKDGELVVSDKNTINAPLLYKALEWCWNNFNIHFLSISKFQKGNNVRVICPLESNSNGFTSREKGAASKSNSFNDCVNELLNISIELIINNIKMRME